MERIQSLMDPNNNEQSNTDSLIDQEEDIEDTSMPAVSENPQTEATNLEEERMFKNAKMFVDHGNGSFTTKKLLFIRLLSLMRDIGAPLKTHGKIVSLF
jgi:hypothetical protein